MLRVGIIGSGFGLYGLLPAFNSLQKCKVVSICGKKTHRLTSYCNKIGLKNIYTSWRIMLKKEKLDAIAIAVIPNEQYKIAKIAIEKGLHIFAEKPLAATLPQAKELLVLARRRGITNFIDFIFPEIEQWQKVKRLLTKRVYGKLKHISLNWDFLSYDLKNKKNSWKTNPAEGGGALSFFFSHSLYYLEYFAGEISNLKSFLSHSKQSLNGGEVGVDLIMEFKTGVNGYAHLNCNSKHLNRHQLIFSCEQATLVLENENRITDNFTVKIITSRKIKVLSSKEIQTQSEEDERVKVVKKIASRFVDCCIHKKKMIPSFKEGFRVQELIEKIRTQE